MINVIMVIIVTDFATPPYEIPAKPESPFPTPVRARKTLYKAIDISSTVAILFTGNNNFSPISRISARVAVFPNSRVLFTR